MLVGKSVSTLKNMSYKIGDELDQQAVYAKHGFSCVQSLRYHAYELRLFQFSMLDDLGQEMDTVDTKLDGVMKKIAKLTHMDDGML